VQFGQWLGLVVILISLYVVWQIRQLLLMAFGAILLATSLNQLARYYRHQLKISRSRSLLLALMTFLGTLVAFFWAIVPSLTVQVREIGTSQIPRLLRLAQTWEVTLRQYVPESMLPDMEKLPQQVQPVLQSLLGSSLAIFSGSLGTLLNLLLLIVLTIMLLVQPQAYRRVFVSLFPQFYRHRVEEILDECEVSLGKWVVGAMIGMVAIALLTTIGLYILGVPAPLALGILAGLLNFIPNLGPTLSVILPMGIALLDSPLKSLLVFILYFIVQQIESSLLTPYIMSRQVSLLPALTLLAQLFFASFFGFAGLILALPLSVVTMIWFRSVLIEDVLNNWRKRPLMLQAAPLLLDPWEAPKNDLGANDLVASELVSTIAQDAGAE
jgi:predicted PurR-regulated permease PerM